MDSLQLSHSGKQNYVNDGNYGTNKLPLILAVDDDADNLLLMTYTIEMLNCSVLTAVDGQSALEKAKTHQPDLILLDIMLSKLDGLELICQLKQHPRTSKIPVIAVTALARAEDKQRILQAGFDEYISKPYMLEDFESLICRYLNLALP